MLGKTGKGKNMIEYASYFQIREDRKRVAENEYSVQNDIEGSEKFQQVNPWNSQGDVGASTTLSNPSSVCEHKSKHKLPQTIRTYD